MRFWSKLTSSEASRDTAATEPEYVAIARIQKPQGRRGEVAAEILTDFPERFAPGLEAVLGDAEPRRRLIVESAWFHKAQHQERVILKFEGIDSITEAESLRGAIVQVPRSKRIPLPADRVYVSDLIGCSVFEGEEVLGKVAGWEETGAAPLLRVERSEAGSAGGEMLIPYIPEICYSVDTARREIRVKTPEGLRELNQVATPAPKTIRKNQR